MTPLSEARRRLGEIIDEVNATGSIVLISRHGQQVAVIMSAGEYESLLESLNILTDDATMIAIAEAERDVAAGELVDFD